MKKITKKEFKKRVAKKIEKLVVVASVLMLVYLVLCYVDVVAKNVEPNQELSTWNILYDYKMEIITK